MKVCVFGLRGFPGIQGGVEKHCEALYPHFSVEDAEFVIFRRKPYVCSTPEYGHIHFIDLPSTRIKGLEPVLHSLLATLRSISIKADIVHIHNIGPALFCPLLKLFGKKVVVTYHSANYEHQKWGRFARKLLLFCERLVLKYADRVIFVNRFQMEKMPDEYRQKLIYIPNGIADDLCPSDKTDCIEKLGLERFRYVFALGRITPEKGFDILLDAFNQAETGDFKLCIAGGVETERDYYESLKAKAGKNVIFPGFVSGELLRQLYSHARLFVLPSRNEGFPLALLDAMAYGCDILASDIPASHLVKLPECSYFRKEDIEQLSSLIKDKINGKPVSREYDLSQFDWKGIACDTLKAYQGCYER